MYLVVAYDISDDGRRARLYELLLGYGSPVQRSVFECDLTAEQEAALRRKAERYARGPGDSIRYYELCAACARRTELAGTELSEERDGDYFV